MSYNDLTAEQKAGIDYNSNHNGFATVEEYIQMRLEQDADRGYKEMVALQLSGIISKVTAEPTILPVVEAAADAEIASIEAVRQAEADALAASNEEPQEP